MIVCPSRRKSSARRIRASAAGSAAGAGPGAAARARSIIGRLPRATCRPPTVPVTPAPVSDSKLDAAAGGIPRSRAPAMIAAARGCSLPVSSPAERRSTSSSEIPAAARTVTSRGRPSVSVPVLSTTRVSAFSSLSRAEALRIRTPAAAPRPVATMIEMGVASPRAHGQAMIRTATAATTACARRGSGPATSQARKAAAATAITAGTNHDDTTSASLWIGARLRCASLTIRTIWARSVSAPTRSARITRLPVPLTVPPISRSPGPFSAGIGSPVIIDSSTALRPSRMMPSTGAFSPGRTRSRSPGCTFSRGMSSSVPSSCRRRAVRGCSPRSARMAPPVRRRARNSRTCPRSTRTVITAAVSK